MTVNFCCSAAQEEKSLKLVERSLESFVKLGNGISKVFDAWKKDLTNYVAEQKSIVCSWELASLHTAQF